MSDFSKNAQLKARGAAGFVDGAIYIEEHIFY